MLRVVAPWLQERLDPGARGLNGGVYFSAVPTVRVQQPSCMPGIRPHCDAMYGLQEGSINWWVPLTAPGLACSTLHLESFPGGGDFHPLLPSVDTAVCFDGYGCVHYTVQNTSKRTRISLDFRVVPKAAYNARNRLAKSNYFSLAEYVCTPDEFVIASRGQVSKLHGMPFTDSL